MEGLKACATPTRVLPEASRPACDWLAGEGVGAGAAVEVGVDVGAGVGVGVFTARGLISTPLCVSAGP